MNLITLVADNATTLLTALTVLILSHYTKETYLLRKESQKQTEHLFTPYLSLRNSEDGLELVNLGKGIAKDATVDPSIEIEGSKILPIPTIGPGEERSLYYLDKEGQGSWHVHGRNVPDKILLTYLDTLGSKYRAQFVRIPNTHGLFNEVFQVRA